MADEVELFDLASRAPCASWSLNPWKTRLALNYKKIPYKTTWLEYPEITPTFKSFGITANEGDNATPYTIPTVKLPDGRYVMDSAKIAPELERIQPTPSLNLDDPVNGQVADIFARAMIPLRPVVMPKIPRHTLNEASIPYFNESRHQRFSMPLDRFEKEKGGEEAWMAAKPALLQLNDLLGQNTTGPFFLGNKPSQADFIVVAALEFFRRLNEGILQRVFEFVPRSRALYEACAPYLERNDH